MAYEWENSILPDFGTTPHLPFKPNAERTDRIASPKDAAMIFDKSLTVCVEEKLDAANSGICHWVEGRDEQPIIRNRNHVLRKGYGRKNTDAKAQFTRIWNWYYEHLDNFQSLNEAVGFNASVYGEWMYYQHTIYYDRLPKWFVAYAIYDHENKLFLPTLTARKHLKDAGFVCAPLLQIGVDKYEQLEELFTRSPFSDEVREGAVIKVSDSQRELARFKIVRPDYQRGVHFGESLNKLGEPHPYEEPV